MTLLIKDALDLACGRIWFRGLNALADFAPAFDVEMKRIAVAPPEPIVANAFDAQIREHDVAHRAAVEIHESDAAIGTGDDAVVDGDVADGIHVAVAELDGAGRRSQPAIGDGNILAGQRRTKPVHGVEHDRVVAGLDGAVGDAHIFAAVRINAVRPDAFGQAGVDVDAVDHQSLAGIRVNRPGRRIDQVQTRNADVLAAEEKEQLAELVLLRKGTQQRLARGLHPLEVRPNVIVLNVVQPPFVGALAIDRPAPFDRDVQPRHPQRSGRPGRMHSCL